MSLEKQVEKFLNGMDKNEKMYFVGSSTKNPLRYKQDEEIIFKIRVESDEGYVDVPYVYYELLSDDQKSSSGFAEKVDDWFYITTSIGREGFVKLVAKACDYDKNIIEEIDVFEGGAGADIDKISCCTPVPDDFHEYWDSLKQETEEIEPEVIYEKEFFNERYPNHRLFDVRVKVTDDMYTSFVVTYPKEAEEGSLGLKFFYSGYGVAGKNILALNVDKQFMCIIQNSHGIPNFEPPEYYQNLKETTLKMFGFNEQENERPETTYWAGMFKRNYQTLRYIKNHPLLNNEEIIFVGGSMGAMQACHMAAHSGCGTLCHLVAPWFCDLAANEKIGRLLGWRPKYKNGLAYFDTAVNASFVKFEIKITSAGLGDYVCPPSGLTALYNNIKSPKSIEFVQNRTHSYEAPGAEKYYIENK